MFRQGHTKFIENPAHYFECFHPNSEGEFDWRSHPIIPNLKCNQWGGLFWEEDDYEIVPYRPSHKYGHGYCQIQRYWEDGKRPDGHQGKPINKYLHGEYPGMVDGRLRPKIALVYECWYGAIEVNMPRLVHWNCNLWDFRPENIRLCNFAGFTDWRRRHKVFGERTGKELKKREWRPIQMEMDPSDYFRNVLGVPKLYVDYWKKL